MCLTCFPFLWTQVEDLLRNYDNVCTLRVRMPISSDLSNPRNFITKITRYEKVVDIPNSMTILDELLPISIEMAKRNLTGIWNFTNPGVVSHNEILQMYKDYIDSSFTWKNFTLEEQAKVIVAPRSNNELDAGKLKKEFPELLSIKESLIENVFKPNQKVKAWVARLTILSYIISLFWFISVVWMLQRCASPFIWFSACIFIYMLYLYQLLNKLVASYSLRRNCFVCFISCMNFNCIWSVWARAFADFCGREQWSSRINAEKIYIS